MVHSSWVRCIAFLPLTEKQQKLKQAKEEAEKEVEEYRNQLEQEYKKKEQQVYNFLRHCSRLHLRKENRY